MPEMPDPYELIQWRGGPEKVDRRTAAMLTVMEEKLGYELSVVQGFDPLGGVSASAGTHGHGAVDLAPFDWRNKVAVGRKVGFDIWHRMPNEGPWAEHEHGIDHGNKRLTGPAQRQTVQYDNKTNGLANFGPDTFFFHPDRPPVFNYAAWWKDQQAAKRDDIARANVKKWRATRKRLAERISTLRARRAMLKAKIAAAQKQLDN